jgi:hypothetical protein
LSFSTAAITGAADLRHVFEPKHAIFGEMRTQDASGGETQFREKRPANAHHDRTLDLVARSIGIDHCAALEGLHDAFDLGVRVFRRACSFRM